MGIAIGAARIFLKELRRRPFKGRVLVLGKQDVFFDYKALAKAAHDFGVELKVPEAIKISLKPDHASSNFISDESLFLALGFDEYAAIDYSAYESADYVFDLNQSDPPPSLLESCDLIVDCGTIEHVFHLPNALRNIFRMLKSDGRVIHLAPSSNYIDHGFYMFSPTLFWDFYSANKFDINTFQVIRHTVNAHTEPWEASDYRPGCLEAVSFGGLDDGMYGILCIATKTEDSTGDAIPQQYYFTRRWFPEEAPAPEPPSETPKIPSDAVEPPAVDPYEQLKSRIRRHSVLFSILRMPFRAARFVKRSMQRETKPPVPEVKRGLGLDIIDRY
jgi:SAM-dependent methyltransferase